MKRKQLVIRRVGITLSLALLLLVGTVFTGFSSSPKNEIDKSMETVTISKIEYERLRQYEELDELCRMVEKYYYLEPDKNAMLEGAKYGLLAGLGDPYTYYYDPQEYAEMWEGDAGNYSGVGIQISASYTTKECTISRVFKGSPAEKSGLRKGDVLLTVDGMEVTTATLNNAVKHMRGVSGESVTMQVRRKDAILDYTLYRAVVDVNWVSSCMLEQAVGYICLYEFSGNCALKFQEQLDALKKQGVKALILDLRDNPGGWIDDAVKLADIFLPEGVVATLKNRAGESYAYRTTPGKLDIPLVVLVNENSASASEVLAGALQDRGAATIVGTKSFGKGIVQYVLPVGNKGAGVQITSDQYYTPNGHSVHKVGITPDVEIQSEDTMLYDLGDMRDAQLKKAFDVVLQKVAGTYSVTPRPLNKMGEPS